MHHNRKLYNTIPSVLYIVDSNSDREIINSLPKWFEQIFRAKIIICTKHNFKSYYLIAEICNRYKKTISEDIDAEADCIVIDYDDISNIVCDVLIVTQKHNMPLPYFIDIAMMTVEQNLIIKCHDTYVFAKSYFIDSAYNSIESLLSLLKNETKFYNINDYAIANTVQHNNSSSTSKCAILIPCMNRIDNLEVTLPQWISQLHINKQIVVIDYSSSENILECVTNICHKYRQILSIDKFDENSDIIYFRINNKNFFNISHAYNYAASRITCDILCTVCADSCPRDYYLDIITSLIDDNSIIQIWWGLHAITYSNWKKLNGHQEFIVGWGAEDDDFRIRATLMGLKLKIIPKEIVFHVPQDILAKGKTREISDIYVSSQINSNRFSYYISRHGYIGNYGLPIGQENPIKYIESNIFDKKISMCCFKEEYKELPDFVKKYNNIFYIEVDKTNTEWGSHDKWKEYGKIHHQSTVVCHDLTIDNINSAITKFMKEKDDLKELL